MRCLESEEVARERRDRKDRVLTFWLSLTLAVLLVALYLEVTR